MMYVYQLVHILQDFPPYFEVVFPVFPFSPKGERLPIKGATVMNKRGPDDQREMREVVIAYWEI